MLKSLMVFPDTNNIFNVTNTQLNENVAKLIQQQSDSDLGSSLNQDYILDSVYSSSSSHIKPSQPPHFSQQNSHSHSHTNSQLQPQQLQPQPQPQPQPQQQPQPQPQQQQQQQQQQTHHQQPLHQQSIHQQHLHQQPLHQQQPSQPQHPSPPQTRRQSIHSQQQNMHFSIMSPMIVSNHLSAPSSPPYATIKTEEGLHHNIDYSFMYPPFDMHSQSPPQILPSQRSTQSLSHHQRMLSYGQSQQQQMRFQQQYHNSQQQHQLLYDPSPATPGRSAITSAMSMPMSLSVSVPITSGPSSLMINSPTVTSNNIFTSTGASGFGTSHHLNEDVSATGHHKMSTAAVMASLQSQHSDVIHPASPKRQRHDSIHQQHHALAQLSPGSIDSTSGVASVALSTGAGATAGATMASMNTGVTKRPRRSSTSSSRTSTGSHLDLSTDPRASKVAKTSASSSAPVAASGSIDSVGRRVSSHSVKGSGVATAQVPSHLQHHAFHASQSHAQLQHLSQPVDYTQTQVQAHAYARSTNSTGSGNITHPRRAAQNRAAQRTFRNRRKAYIKDMEQKVLELNQTRSRFEAIQNENREIWGRYRALESLVAQNGLSAPQFPPMTPFFETEAGIAAAAASYTGPAGTANTSSAAEAGTSNQANKVSKVEESETSLLGHQVHYKQSSSERSDDDQDEDDTHEFNQDLGDYTITSTSQRQQQQQRQRQRMDTHVQDLDIRRQ